MERTDLSDRRFEVLLERLDRIADELARMNKRLDHDENFLRLTRELASLNESLQAIAYAALGQQAPQVRRRRGASDRAQRARNPLRPAPARAPSSESRPRVAEPRQSGAVPSGTDYGTCQMSSTPLVAWSFAFPSGSATRPSTTIGLFQWPPPHGSVATSLPVPGR